MDGEIVLSRETISTGSVVRGSNSNQNPIILKDNVGSPINSSVLNSESGKQGAWSSYNTFAPKGWQQEVIDDASSPLGYSVYVESSTNADSVEVSNSILKENKYCALT